MSDDYLLFDLILEVFGCENVEITDTFEYEDYQSDTPKDQTKATSSD